MGIDARIHDARSKRGELVFCLAAMSLGLRLLTGALFGVPLLLAYAAWTAPAPVSDVLAGTAVFVSLVYASVWVFWRPSRFEIAGDALRIVWPLRSRAIPLSAIEDARIVDAATFRREFGYGVRVGAGGLWGGFGLLRTRSQTFSMWISRTDRFVVARVDGARPLLITPERPHEFVDAVRRHRA